MPTSRFHFRDWLELARVSNLPTVWTNILAAWLLAGGTWNWHPLVWLFFGGSLIYTGGMILNDAADVKFDREFRQGRPLPSGRVSVTSAWAIGTGSLLAGFLTMVWGAETCIWITSALVAAIVFYDLYHKPWAGSVFIMGSCRTLLYLVAASAVTGTLNWSSYHEVIIKAIALGGYVVGLTFVARHESGSEKSSSTAHAASLMALGSPIFAGLAYSVVHKDSIRGIFMS
ncbi:MAG: UbiA family prenyltransferase, partial [Verrucomicrobiaceae bacterium]